jgi:hypothetical protein
MWQQQLNKTSGVSLCSPENRNTLQNENDNKTPKRNQKNKKNKSHHTIDESKSTEHNLKGDSLQIYSEKSVRPNR